MPPALLVSVIAVLVILVSLPRFRAHVVRAGRVDAPTTLGLLGAEADGARSGTLFELVQDTPGLLHRLRDARVEPDDPETMGHHGYLFSTGRILSDVPEEAALVAWPRAFGESGDFAYALARDGRMYVHHNGGLWSGKERPLMDIDLSDEGWVLRTR